MDDLLREHEHMLDTVTRECLLTDQTLASAVDEFLRDTHEFCARTAVACDSATTTHTPVTVRMPAVDDAERVVYTRCVKQLNTMMTSMMKLPTSTTAGYRTAHAPPPPSARRVDDDKKPPLHTFKAATMAHACAHEQFISRCVVLGQDLGY